MFTIFNDIIKAKSHFETQSIRPDSDFHSEGYLPETLEIGLEKLGLSQDEKSKKYYFEIPTNSNNILNNYHNLLNLGNKDLIIYDGNIKHPGHYGFSLFLYASFLQLI